MSLEAILEVIEASGKANTQEIMAEAESEAARILSQAEHAAREIVLEAEQAGTALAAADSARITHRAQLEALRVSGAAQAMVVDRALEVVKSRLARLRSDAAYPRVLAALFDEALKVLAGSLNPGEEAHIRIDPRDRALVEQMLRDRDIDLPISCDLETWGGLLVVTPDQDVVADNTLEVRLENAVPHVKRLLPAILNSIDAQAV